MGRTNKKKKNKKQGIVITLSNVVDLIKLIMVTSITFIIFSIIGLFFVDKQSEATVIYLITIGLNIILFLISLIAYKKFNKKINSYD
ncbi:hypothetical protein [Clostridium sp.]|uniref:hypothetical protein n=1 Tax=Clostridium sp. TaxID=1506 RepID=UPI0026383D4E|nr:hypothetical protein [Clostridium sp.]